MKISLKLILGYCIIASLVFVVSFVSVAMVRDTEAIYDEVATDVLPTTMLIKDVRYLALRIIMSTNELGLIYAEQREFGEDFKELYAEEREELDEEVIEPYEQTIETYIELVRTEFPEELEEAEEIYHLGEKILKQSLNLINQQEEGLSGHDILELKEELEEVEEEFLETTDEALAQELAELKEHTTGLSTNIKAGISNIQLTSVLTFAAAILLGVLLSRQLSSPIRALANASDAIAKGHLDTRVDVNSSDEIGQLAASFNAMTETLSQTTVSKNYVDNILASMGDALFVLDKDGQISRTNKAVNDLLGYCEGELEGTAFSRLVAAEGVAEEKCLGMTERDTLCECETSFISQTDEHIPVHLSSALLYNDNGELMGAVYLAKDIRERLRTAQALADKNTELEESNNELGRFAYIVSHDLKAPLRAIANLATWIEEDLEDKLDEDTKNNMVLMHSRIGRMESLINGVLEYSRIGRSKDQLENVDVQKLLADVVDSMPVPEGFQIHLADNMPNVPASSVRLSQVFSNLISNAIKYRSEEDGRVDVTVADEDAFYRFSVADNGPGIAAEYHDKVFEIFQTLNARDKVESTGVGLTLIKKIIEDQGGNIAVESEEGNGATFSFTWPKQQMESSE